MGADEGPGGSPRGRTHAVRSRQPEDPPNVQSLRFGFERVLHRLADVAGADRSLRHLGSFLRLARVRARNVDVVHLHVLYGTGRGWISFGALGRS
jgi:hypothetical protein